MSIQQLQIVNFRNISSLNISCDSKINIIYGLNGSGKTSVLEALFMLGTGKSFRSHLKSRIIQYEKPSLTLFTRLIHADDQVKSLGIEKSIAGDTKLRLQSNDVPSISEFAKLLPLQLLHPHSYELLEGGSKPRRQFIDWGVFHVEHQFHQLWSELQRILKQRNAAIKSQLPRNQIQLWDVELVRLSEAVDCLRQEYCLQLTPIFLQILAQITDIPDVDVTYYSGWSQRLSFAEQLTQRLTADIQSGYTLVGPHRADLKLSVAGVPAQDALSRGQQKLLVFAMRFAQAQLLQQQTSKKAIFLIDDLPSELDMEHQAKLFLLIQQLSETNQFFLTGVQQQNFDTLVNAKLFHVKQGEIEADSRKDVLSTV